MNVIMNGSAKHGIFADGGAKVPTQEKKKKKRLRKLGNIRKVPKLHRMIAQRHAPLPNCPQIYAERGKSSYS